MKKFNVLDWISWILLIIGGINWGLIGFFKLDLIATLFGDMTLISRIIYALVGLAALYCIFMMIKMRKAF